MRVRDQGHWPPREVSPEVSRGRMVGESYRDACERLTGELKAQDIDLARLGAIEREAITALSSEERRAMRIGHAVMVIAAELCSEFGRPKADAP